MRVCGTGIKICGQSTCCFLQGSKFDDTLRMCWKGQVVTHLPWEHVFNPQQGHARLGYSRRIKMSRDLEVVQPLINHILIK